MAHGEKEVKRGGGAVRAPLNEVGELFVNLKDRLHQMVDELPEERLRELLDFAQFLDQKEEWDAWREAGRRRLGSLYGPDEPRTTARFR
jgi:hypothetical protein